MFGATSNVSEEAVCVKVELPYDDIFLLSHEARLLGYFSSKRVVKRLGFFRLNDNDIQISVLVLEPCGISLKSWLAQDQNLVDRVLVSTEIIRAMEQVHDASVIYRDVSLGNVCIGPENSVKLIDFGLGTIEDVQKINPDEVLPDLMGSHPYLSLAALSLQKPFYRDDMESLGYLIWNILDPDSFWWTENKDEKKQLKYVQKVTKDSRTPPVIAKYIQYCRSLPRLTQTPGSYEQLISLVTQWPGYRHRSPSKRIFTEAQSGGRMTRSQTRRRQLEALSDTTSGPRASPKKPRTSRSKPRQLTCSPASRRMNLAVEEDSKPYTVEEFVRADLPPRAKITPQLFPGIDAVGCEALRTKGVSNVSEMLSLFFEYGKKGFKKQLQEVGISSENAASCGDAIHQRIKHNR